MMWQDFDKKGYKPRTELSVPKDSGESLEDFETVASRIEFQLNEFISKWDADKYVYTKALNYLMPPQKGKMLWINKGGDKDISIVLTKEGKSWLKKQLEDFASSGKSNIKYAGDRGVKS